MEVFKAIFERRSIRKFLPKKVPLSITKKIIEAGNFAPSACNKQGWRFILIEDEKIKKRLIDECTAYFIKDAPNLMLVLYDNRTEDLEHQDHYQSAAACIQNMHLAAHALGLGSCWVCNLPTKKRLRKIFNIPKNYDPIALFVFGYYDKKINPLPRKLKVDDLISYNEFNFKEKASKFDLKLKTKRILKKIYYRLPVFLKKILDPYARKFEKRFD